MDYFKEDIFRTFNVTSRQGWEFLKDGASSRRLHNEPDREEPRGRKPLISLEKIREMERISETEGIEARSYTWEQLGFEVGLECSGRTVQKAMGTMDYHKCIACRRGWVNQKTAKDRTNWASVFFFSFFSSSFTSICNPLGYDRLGSLRTRCHLVFTPYSTISAFLPLRVTATFG